MKKNNTIEIQTSLSPEEAMFRLENASDEDRFAFSLSGHAGNSPFLLRRKADQFRVEKRRYYNNGFHPFLYGRIEPATCGSRITGHFAMDKLARGFMTFWFVFLGLFSIIWIPALISQYLRGEIKGNDVLWIFHPIAMMLFGYLMVLFGKFLARKEASAITDWLCDLYADVTLQIPDGEAQQPVPTESRGRIQPRNEIAKQRYIPPKKSYWKYLLAWVVLAVFFALLIGSANWRRYQHIATHGCRTQATIIALLPQDHNTARYRYQVNGQTFEGQMQSWEPNPDLKQMHVGQTVVVYYDSERPEVSVLGDPKPILHNETVSILMAALFIPTVIVLGWYVKRNSW